MTHIYFLVYDLSRFHHNNFRDTISWECIVKDDSITSCLIELQCLTLSKLYIDPIHRVLVSFFHVFWLYLSRRCLVKSSLYGSLCSLSMGFTAVKNTVCLSLLEFCRPTINPEFVMECKLIARPINMINVLEEMVRN